MSTSGSKGSAPEEITAATQASNPARAEIGAKVAVPSATATDATDAIEATATSPGTEAVEAPAEKAELAPGTTVGRYIVLDKIAAGGMGAIYCAFDPELDRKIALKVLAVDHGESETAAVATARMIREAKALAQLSHPNVVSVHDVGRYDGDVFIAMALVQGETLRAWNKEKHSIAEIVELFSGAGEGLAAAHRAGLVHRDFKPDNVLIGNDGRVRVVDFGIARAEGADDGTSIGSELSGSHASLSLSSAGETSGVDFRSSDDHSQSGELLTSATSATSATTPLTEVGALVGTPAYMSPEQFLGTAVDSRSDQFSFCIALYESLYGRRPFSGKSASQLRRAVTTGRVRWPRKDSRVPIHLRRLIERGLSVSPDDRYPSMEELLTALRDDPRGRRRRRLAIAVSIAVAGASVLAARAATDDAGARCDSVGVAVDAVWSDDARAAVGRTLASARASYAADTAERVQVLLDARAKAWKKARRNVCEATWLRGEQSEALLDVRMYCLDRRLNEMTSLVELFSGEPDKDLVEKAVEATSSLTPVQSCAQVADLTGENSPPRPSDPEARARLNELHKRIDELRIMNATGQYRQGVEASEALVEDAESLGYAPARAELMSIRGSLLQGAGNHEAAEATLARGLTIAARAGDPRLGASMASQRIFIVGYKQDRPAEALLLAPGAEAEIIRAGEPPELAAKLARSLGSVHFAKGEYDKALEHMERSVTMLKKTLADGDLGLADPLNSVGIVLVYLKRFDEGIPYLERARAIFEDKLGPNHPRMGIPLTNLGMAYYQSGRFDEALLAHSRALEVFERALGVDHPHVATALGNIGELLAERGELDKAEAYQRRAVAIREAQGNLRHHAYGFALNNVGSTLRRRGKHEDALDFHRRALEVYEASLGGDHEYAGAAIMGMGGALLGLGQTAEAIEALERAVRVLEAAESADLPHARFLLAQALWETRRDRAGARALAEKARTSLAERPDAADALASVDGWLADHEVP